MISIGDRLMGRSDTARSYAQEREYLADDLARLGGMAERATLGALDAVTRRDTQAACQLTARRKEFGEMQAQVERDVVRVIALWRPLATEVEDLIAVLKVSAHLARIGELACNIARRAETLNAAEPLVLMRSIDRMGRRVADLLRGALDGYARQDQALVVDVGQRDDDVDDAYDSLFKELLAAIADDPALSRPCTHMMLVAKDLERIGDRSTDIADIAYVLMTGGDVTQCELDRPGT